MNLRISTDPAELDVGMIHFLLADESYWARGIARPVLERALAHSLGKHAGYRTAKGYRGAADFQISKTDIRLFSRNRGHISLSVPRSAYTLIGFKKSIHI